MNDFKAFYRSSGRGALATWEWLPEAGRPYLYLFQAVDGLWRTGGEAEIDDPGHATAADAARAAGINPVLFPDLPTGWDWGVVSYPECRLLARAATREEAHTLSKGKETYSPFPVCRSIPLGETISLYTFFGHI